MKLLDRLVSAQTKCSVNVSSFLSSFIKIIYSFIPQTVECPMYEKEEGNRT